MKREKISESELRKRIDQLLHELSGHHIVPPTIVLAPESSPNWHLAPDTPQWIHTAIEPLYRQFDLADDVSLVRD